MASASKGDDRGYVSGTIHLHVQLISHAASPGPRILTIIDLLKDLNQKEIRDLVHVHLGNEKKILTDGA
jgi:hypothetical protein